MDAQTSLSAAAEACTSAFRDKWGCRYCSVPRDIEPLSPKAYRRKCRLVQPLAFAAPALDVGGLQTAASNFCCMSACARLNIG